MKLYFAGMLYNEDLEKRVLVSYLELKKLTIEIKSSQDVFLDSGAYSAFTQKLHIDVSDYGDFLLKNGKNFTVYANLDVIGDDKASDENLHILESLGLKPLPVFHYGSNYKKLGVLAQKYPYIALGGLVPIARKKRQLHEHLRRCFANMKGVRVHGFGVCAKDVLENFPFYSVDATTWMVGSRFSHICDAHTMTQRITKQNLLRSGNISEIKAIMDKNADAINIQRFLELENYITNLWKKRGVVFVEYHS